MVFLFRRQIAQFLERLNRVKVSGAEFQATDEAGSGETDATVSPQTQEESVPNGEAGPVEESPPNAVEESPPNANAFLQMVGAFANSDFAAAKQAYEEHREAMQSEDEQRELDAHYLSLRYTRAADSEALAKLQALSSHESTKVSVLSSLARCYWSTKDYSMARKIYSEARESADEIDAARLTVNIAECWEKEGSPDRGIEALISKVAEVEQGAAKLLLYKCMASMYQATGSERLRAIALEKALEFAPSDRELRFSAAYAQSEVKLHAVSIANYDTLLTLKPGEVNALNNLGVECKSLGLPLKAIKCYKRAAGGGNTLAMANMANLLMEMGFGEEADEQLSRARALPEPHENVSSAKAQLEGSKRKELEKWTEVVETGARQQAFLRGFAEAMIEETTGNAFLGSWELPDGGTCSAEIDRARLRLEFSNAGKRRRFEAIVKNRSAEGRLLIWRQYTQGHGMFQEGNDAVATVSTDGATLSLLELSNSSSVLELTRVPELT